MDEATKKAKSDVEIPLAELTADIYANPENSEQIRNILPVNPLKHITVGKAVNV